MIYFTYFLTVLLLIGFDQYSKYLIVKNVPLNSKIVLIKDFFNITYVKNTGAGFSILQDQTILLSIVSFVVVLILIYLLVKEKKKIYRFAYILIIAGAIGNLIDRIRLKYVVDFLDFYIFGYDFPVFNLADSFITVGAAIIIVYALLENTNARN